MLIENMFKNKMLEFLILMMYACLLKKKRVNVPRRRIQVIV